MNGELAALIDINEIEEMETEQDKPLKDVIIKDCGKYADLKVLY